MKKTIWFTFVVVATMLSASAVYAADTSRKVVSKNTYPLTVFEHPKYFKGVIEKHHLKRMTARQAGISHVIVYDEFRHYAKKAELGDDRLVWVDENMRPWYIDGCFNRIDVAPAEAPPPPKVVVETRVVEKEVPVPVRPSGHWVCVPAQFKCIPVCVRGFRGRPHMEMKRIMVSRPHRIWVSDNNPGMYAERGFQGGPGGMNMGGPRFRGGPPQGMPEPSGPQVVDRALANLARLVDLQGD